MFRLVSRARVYGILGSRRSIEEFRCHATLRSTPWPASRGRARADRVLVNMLEGKMFVEFRAESREALELWLKTEGMHFDFLVRIEWEMRGDTLELAE